MFQDPVASVVTCVQCMYMYAVLLWQCSGSGATGELEGHVWFNRWNCVSMQFRTGMMIIRLC